jgi:hypothetical protein
MDSQTFIAIYDEFEDVKIQKVQYYLSLATNHIDPDIYGIHTEQAIGLYTAHLLTLNPSKSANSAAVAALGFKPEDVKKIEITDDIIVEFNPIAKQGSAVQSSSSSGLDATSYGQQLEVLRRSLIIPFTFA